MKTGVYNAQTPELEPFLVRGASFSDGSDSPRALLERCLEKIDAREGEVKAFVVVDADGARISADEATARHKAGKALSPVDGMPVGIKDVIETFNMPTQMESSLFAGWQSGRDAACVRALREAGAIILGKTVTCEFAATVPGKTTNPLDAARTPGGSSSGSAAAVGCGMVSAALGTQVVGSLLRPASYCGCYGYKPSVGGLNRGGVHDYLSQSCLGPIAASLADAWAVAQAISSRVGGDPGYPGLAGPAVLPAATAPERAILIQTAGWEAATPEAISKLERAVAALRSAGVEIMTRENSGLVEAFEVAIADAWPLTTKINVWEFRWPLNDYRHRKSGEMSTTMQERLVEAEEMTIEEYQVLLKVRNDVRRRHAGLAEIADCLITLGATGAAPTGLDFTGNPSFNCPASLIGGPAVTLPLLSCDGLPLGLQFIGYIGGDARLVSQACWVANLAQKTPF